jgi:hypothetical protein
MDLANYLQNGEQSIYDFNTPWSIRLDIIGDDLETCRNQAVSLGLDR